MLERLKHTHTNRVRKEKDFSFRAIMPDWTNRQLLWADLEELKTNTEELIFTHTHTTQFVLILLTTWSLVHHTDGFDMQYIRKSFRYITTHIYKKKDFLFTQLLLVYYPISSISLRYYLFLKPTSIISCCRCRWYRRIRWKNRRWRKIGFLLFNFSLSFNFLPCPWLIFAFDN